MEATAGGVEGVVRRDFEGKVFDTAGVSGDQNSVNRVWAKARGYGCRSDVTGRKHNRWTAR